MCDCEGDFCVYGANKIIIKIEDATPTCIGDDTEGGRSMGSLAHSLSVLSGLCCIGCCCGVVGC